MRGQWSVHDLSCMFYDCVPEVRPGVPLWMWMHVLYVLSGSLCTARGDPCAHEVCGMSTEGGGWELKNESSLYLRFATKDH